MRLQRSTSTPLLPVLVVEPLRQHSADLSIQPAGRIQYGAYSRRTLFRRPQSAQSERSKSSKDVHRTGRHDRSQTLRKDINLQQPWPGRKETLHPKGLSAMEDTRALVALADHDGDGQSNPEHLKSTSSDIPGQSPTRPTASRPESYNVLLLAAHRPARAFPTRRRWMPSLQLCPSIQPKMMRFASFVYIPRIHGAYYHRRIEICIDFDLEMIKHQPEEEEVSLSILSKSHVELLAECAQRWVSQHLFSAFRISTSSRPSTTTARCPSIASRSRLLCHAHPCRDRLCELDARGADETC